MKSLTFLKSDTVYESPYWGILYANRESILKNNDHGTFFENPSEQMSGVCC